MDDEELLSLLEQAEEDVAEEVSAVLHEVADEFAAELADATEIVAARFSVSRIARMWTSWMPRIVRRLLRVSKQAAEHTAETVDGELSPEWEDLPGRYDDDRDLPPAMSEYVDVTEHLLRAVGDRLADGAREELAAGVDAGEDIEQLRARLREAFARKGAQLGEVREERIARTEAGRAWNTATLGAARDATGTPAPIVKQWLSRHDDRVRHDHADANGQIRFLDEQFEVGDVKMDAPHDPTAPASQVVNCRCILAVHPETSASAFDSQAGPAVPLNEPRGNAVTTASSTAFHGTPGRPSYRKYHPKGAGGGGKTKTRGGAMLGSSRYDEDDHKAALRSYRSYGYEKVNGSLRHGDLPDDDRSRQRIRDEVSTLTDLINIQEPTSSATTLYRRTENFRLELSEGDEFHDKGFVSTSSREDVLPVQVSPTDPNYTFFRVNLPSGAQVLDVDAVGVGGFGADEREFILPPGTAFRVTRIVDSGGPDTPPYYELGVTNAVYASAGWPDQHGTSLTAAEDDEEASDLQQRITWARDDIVMDQRADGTSRTAADSHLQGAMIALLPSPQDAERLAIEGGEDTSELHLTLYFLGDDGTAWTEDQRNELIDLVQAAVADLPGPFTANAFGVNHWNPHSDSPSWVWAVGDDRDRPDDAPTLEGVRQLVTNALEDTHDRPDLPVQHSPWSPHVCAQYGDDPAVLPELVDRLGGITFDRVRLAFAGDHTDIPLGPQQEEDIMAADTAQADPMLAVRTWSTPDDTAIAFEDQETGDGRIFAKGSLKWDRAPMPLQYADEMLMGHQGAELAGAILKVKRDGQRITASGPLYANRPAGADAIQLLGEGAPLGISVDLDDVDLEFVDKTLDAEDAEWLFASARLPHASVLPMEDGSMMLSASTRAEWTASDGAISRSRYDLQLISGPDGALTANVIRDAFAGKGVLTAAAGDADDPEKGLVVHAQKSGEFLLRITRARLRGATLVAMPAFKDARIVLDPVDETAAAPMPSITAAGETRDRVVVYVCTSPAAVGARDVSRALGIAMSTARGHLNGAAKDGRIIRLAPGLFCGPSTMPEGELSAAMSGDTDLPVHQDPDASWEGDKAGSRVLAWATDDDGNVDADKLGAAFLWRDEDASTLGAYKLGFCNVFDSDDGPRLEIVAQAVFTIASVLQGGMGGVDVPVGEHEELRGRVETLYGRLAKAYDDDSIRPPWADEDGDETASAGLRELEASAWTAMQQMPPMPAEWFREPTEEELPVDAGGVHYKDGRAFGWVATIAEPHAGYPGKNLTVRKLSQQGFDFSHFLRARFQLDDGTFARVGAMTMNVGHHRDGAECETAACQFDNTRTVGAIVTIGVNERGLWFSGASAPWLSDWDRAVFAACQPSYHLKQARDGSWQLRAVLTVPVPGHSTPLVAALHAVAERSNLALAASAAGFLPAVDDASGHDPEARPDVVRTVSASSTDAAVDLPGQRPDTASGQRPDAVGASVEDVFLSDALVDRFLDRVAEREAERRAEVEAMAALVAQHAATQTVAAQNGVI
ncbi:phage minor head protein [Streptomyces canus]|uniref:phage minor head protein n=1 Tax=Streptomyces canus TaxID=58343 RepID=UPI00339DC26A